MDVNAEANADASSDPSATWWKPAPIVSVSVFWSMFCDVRSREAGDSPTIIKSGA